MKTIPVTPTPWIPPEADRHLRSFFYEYCSLVHLKKGETLEFNKNNRTHPYEDSLILLNKGVIGKSIATHSETKEFFSTLILPNRLYGTGKVIQNIKRPDTLIALRQSEILVLPIRKINALSNNSKKMNEDLMQYCFNCMESERQGMYLVATESVRNRLGKLFRALIHSTDYQEMGCSYQIPIKFSNEEIRRLIYTTKKTINTVLPEWKRLGLYYHNGDTTILSKSIL